MKKQNYLLAGLVTILLIGILSISGCVGDQIPPAVTGGDTLSAPVVPGTPTSGIPTGGGTGDGLPLVDLTSGTEGIARYPGSVMLSSSTTILPQGAYITNSYGTAASIDTVDTWYRDMLENAGWEFAMEYSEEGSTNITYIKDDAKKNVNINISTLENEYTHIVVIYMAEE